MDGKLVSLGPFALELVLDGGAFCGLGAVTYKGTPLRSSRLPWTVYAESDAGVRFERFVLQDVSVLEDEAILYFFSHGEWMPRAQEVDSMGDARIRARRARKPSAAFRWRFRLVREMLWENEWDGLGMRIECDSPGHPLHWLIEDATWEIGGEAHGTTLIQQDISTIQLEQEVERDSSFTTAEKFYTEGWGGCYPMDMLPRAAGASILDFQAKERTAMCLFAERPSLTRARIEKFPDENLIHYTDRPFFPLTESARAPERKLLVRQQESPLKRHDKRNLWLDCFTEVRRRIQASYAFEPEIPQPQVFSHLWDDQLKPLGDRWTDELCQALPEFHRLGYSHVFTHGVLNSVTSDPQPPGQGNICCPYDFEFASSFGGAAAMKRLTEAAERHGMTVFQWFSFHLSRHSPVWNEHPDWIMKEAGGEPYDADYHILWSGRMRSAYRDWVGKQLKRLRGEAGLGGVFWDSYQNFGVTAVDWAAEDKAPQAEEIWTLQAELQRAGYRQRCEVTTIFGVSTVGVYGFETDKFRRRLWADTVRNDDAFVLFDTAPAFFTASYPFTRERISPEVYFWLVAHRVIPSLEACPWKDAAGYPLREFPTLPGGDLAEEYGRVNHLYHAALPAMKRLRLAEGGEYVLWLDEHGAPAVIWAFRDVAIPFHGAARQLCADRSAECDGFLHAQAGEVWRLHP